MKKDIPLDIDDVAALLRISRSKVERWVQQGRIPCKYKGEKCSFRKREILDWAKAHKLPVFDERAEDGVRREDAVSLRTGIARGGVFFNLGGDDKISVLKKAVEALSFPDSIDRKKVLDALVNREEIASTGLGKGVAIPHPRRPIPIKKYMISVFFLNRSIDFFSVDGQPVSILFFLFSSSTQVHLRLLSKLSFCLRETGFLDLLKNCSTSEAVLALIEKYEAELDLSRPG